MIKLIWTLCFLTFALMAWSQSDFVEKGHNGFEINIGQAFVEGKNPFLAYLGGSVNGKLDLGIGLASASSRSLYSFGGAYHIGGEKKELGIALHAAYVVFPDIENYFLFGPSFYARSIAGSIILIPNFGLEFATTSDFNFISTVGFSIFTGGRGGLVVRPQFIFSEEQSYFSLAFGLLTHS